MYSITQTDTGYNIALTRGDTLLLDVSLSSADDSPYTPQEGDYVRFALKKSFKDTGEPLVLCEIPTHTMLLEIRPEQTKPLAFGKYVYDIELTDSYGHVSTPILGEFKLTEEVY